MLKKEVVKTQNKDFEKAGEYRQLLVQAIHNCALKFPDVAGNVVHLLMDFLGDSVSSDWMRVCVPVSRAYDAAMDERPVLVWKARLGPCPSQSHKPWPGHTCTQSAICRTRRPRWT